jgi:hypothetical protein
MAEAVARTLAQPKWPPVVGTVPVVVYDPIVDRNSIERREIAFREFRAELVRLGVLADVHIARTRDELKRKMVEGIGPPSALA